MKICYREDSIKICERGTDDCVACVPGRGKTVERMTESELIEAAGRNAEHVMELSRIIDELMQLYNRAWLGRTNKSALHKQISALSRLGVRISNTGSTIFFNLWMNNIQAPQHEIDIRQ